MGEEDKKVEESKSADGEAKKPEEEKKEEAKAEKPKEEEKKEAKTEESKDAKDADTKESKEPPSPKEIVLRVYMHCEGCARKIKRSLRGFEGVEDVQTDCKTHKVIVKGEKADPLKVLERVQRKSHRHVELLSPIPKPPAEDAKKDEDKKENVKSEEKKEEPQVIVVVLKVYMHCEACTLKIRKCILKMKGVEAVDPDLKSSQVTVKGVFDPPNLVEYVYKRTGKRAVIVKQEPEKKEEKDEKKGEEKEKGGGEGGEKKEEKKEEEKGEAKAAAEEVAGGGGGGGEEETKVVELKKNELLYYYPYYYTPKYAMEHAYPPQIFSDENPNACSIM
ncbi:heavy metal-associated isoprenylated plant protein 7-like [Macadamia integrifolia]|uniref:heavy metal-associated isoprenylated plant protein 7-like n=1 Tax=Macadamia integrifolia TaxID=60698 RepID=UPI001C4ECA08|nr:heavy metal-associated isoprenylated plant protein 7-like [Macadamia integrifolia]